MRFDCSFILHLQVGFIDYISHPLWETWADLVHPDARKILRNLRRNRKWYVGQLPLQDRGSDFDDEEDDEDEEEDEEGDFDEEELEFNEEEDYGKGVDEI